MNHLFMFYVFREIILYDVPKEKKNFLDGEVAIHVSGFGIYPDIYELEQAAAGVKRITLALILISTNTLPTKLTTFKPPSILSSTLLCIFSF